MAVTLTEKAAERVQRFIANRGAGMGLRVGVKSTGCSGFAYVVDLVDDINPDDEVYDSCGVKVIVDPKSLPFVDGTHIDYVQNGLNEGFQYDNPNMKSLCGCGESFGV